MKRSYAQFSNLKDARPKVKVEEKNEDEKIQEEATFDLVNQSTSPLPPGAKRHKANTRERNRMHSLNEALDRLRMSLPLGGLGMSVVANFESNVRVQKLSKIETLRLSRNYLILLTEMLHQDRAFNNLLTGQILAYGLGQHSLNQLAIGLNLDSIRQLGQPPSQVHEIFARYLT